MTAQHPVFQKFTRFKGEAPAGYDRDFIGSKIRQMYWAESPRDTAIEVDVPHPAFDEEYFEWIDVFESVAAARDSYTMIELGAGYGRWAVRAALAVRQYSSIPFQLIAVEADPVHCDWLRMHFEDNDLDPSQHRLLHAAVGRASGVASLVLGSSEVPGPSGENHAPQGRAPQWYGQWLIEGSAWTIPARSKEGSNGVKEATYGGYQVHRHQDGQKSISVPQVTLRSILKHPRRVDLIDLDLQAQELNALSPAIGELNEKVKRLHIGTHAGRHTDEIEDGLRKLLGRNGWQCLADYPGRGSRETPWGTIVFEDGVQSWVNPRV